MAATTLRRIRECLRSRRRSPDAASRWPSGELVFAGTRVEVKTLVDYLKGGHTLDDFLDGGRTLPSSSERTTRRRNGTPADPHLRTGGLRQDHSSEPVAYHALGRAMAGWLSFDEDDNDPLRFWMYFVAALRKLHPDVAGGAMTMLRSPQTPPVERLLTPLINDISGLPRDRGRLHPWCPRVLARAHAAADAPCHRRPHRSATAARPAAGPRPAGRATRCGPSLHHRRDGRFLCGRDGIISADGVRRFTRSPHRRLGRRAATGCAFDAGTTRPH